MVPLVAAFAYIHQKFLVLTSAFQCDLQQHSQLFKSSVCTGCSLGKQQRLKARKWCHRCISDRIRICVTSHKHNSLLPRHTCSPSCSKVLNDTHALHSMHSMHSTRHRQMQCRYYEEPGDCSYTSSCSRLTQGSGDDFAVSKSCA